MERYVLHKLYHLDAVAREGYAAFNFSRGLYYTHVIPKRIANANFVVVTELSNFANITLSSVYHDIAKDRLYCHPADSFERRVIVTTMEQVNKSRCFPMSYANLVIRSSTDLPRSWHQYYLILQRKSIRHGMRVVRLCHQYSLNLGGHW